VGRVAATYIAAITGSSTSSLVVQTGTGTPTFSGGGGGGSGPGGGAVTMAAGAVASGAYVAGALADGAIVTQGAKADSAWVSGSGSEIALLKAIAASAISTAPTSVQGAAASGATVSGNPLLSGCRAASAAPTAVTDGQAVAAECGLEGRVVIAPYSIKEIQVRGSTGAQTGTGAQTVIASAGGSLKNYITSMQCANSGATTSIVTLNDSATTVLINPAGGGTNVVFPVPLVTAAATALTANFGSASTSQYCNAQGYTGL
jgi:hypothetical protein